MLHCCSFQSPLLRDGACNLTILDNTTRAKIEQSFLSPRNLHISRHRHDTRAEHASLLQVSIAVAARRCLQPYNSRQYHARENRKIVFWSPRNLQISRRRHDPRDEHALLLRFSIAVDAIRCLQPYNSRQYHARGNRKIVFLVSPKPSDLAPPPRPT